MEYGRHLLDEWMLDPAIAYLNHGTVGAPPRRVMAEYRRIQDTIERQPAQFQLRDLADIDGQGLPPRPHMRVAAEGVARHLGCAPSNLVFVDNATTGVNAVLRSFPFAHGDEILVTNLGYGAVTYTANYVARENGCTVRTVDLPPYDATPDEYVALIEAAVTGETRIVIIDHITSQTALVMPIKEIIAKCHARGALVLVDAAHTPGAIHVDIESYGADWYTANLHKWGFAPRSCGILWADPKHHQTLHPTVISWGLDNGITAEFDLLGTRDPAPFLTAPFALDLIEEWGGARLRGHNHDLVMEAATMVAEAFGRPMNTPGEMIGPMVNVGLPLTFGTTKDEANALQYRLLNTHGIELPLFPDDGGLRMRISAQIYNDRSDIERLVTALRAES
ncbi:MAG: Isopenicillin epimerase [Actinomycetota bacterium]